MDKSKIKGWLYKAEEDTLFLLTAGKKKYSVNDKKPDYDERNLKIMADQIQKIYLEKKKANLKGILIGLGAGAITGAIIGYSQGDDPPGSLPRDLFDPPMKAEEKALYSGISGGVLGAFAGYIIAKLARKKFIIGGKKEAFRNSHRELLEKSLVY